MLPPAEKAEAFRVAEAVRHVEIGLTSFTQLTLGLALFLFGVAIALDSTFPRLLGWAAMAIGANSDQASKVANHRSTGPQSSPAVRRCPYDADATASLAALLTASATASRTAWRPPIFSSSARPRA